MTGGHGPPTLEAAARPLLGRGSAAAASGAAAAADGVHLVEPAYAILAAELQKALGPILRGEGSPASPTQGTTPPQGHRAIRRGR